MESYLPRIDAWLDSAYIILKSMFSEKFRSDSDKVIFIRHNT